MSHTTPESAPHPLDPLTANEVQRGAEILQTHIACVPNDLKFKVIDLAEPPKALTLQYLRHNGAVPDRKARIYYHLKESQDLLVGIANLTTGKIERKWIAADAQGPVDWQEFELVNRACNDHPDVKAEVAKLKLPPR